MRETLNGATVNSEQETGSRKPLTAHCSPLTAYRSPLTSGFVLPAAIFLLVVLGGLAAWMMQLTQTTQGQDILALEGERAYRAAEAGLEAGIYAASQASPSCAAQNIALTGALSRFTASVSCTTSTANEAGSDITFYLLTSIACNQPAGGVCPNPSPTSPEYAERRVSASVED